MSSTRVENNAKFSEILRRADSPRSCGATMPWRRGREPTVRPRSTTDNPDVEVANLRFDLHRRLNKREILKYLMARDALWDGDSPRRACGVSHQPERMVSVCLQHGSTTMLLKLKRRFSASTSRPRRASCRLHV